MNDAVRAVFWQVHRRPISIRLRGVHVERMVVVPANPDAVPPTDAIMEGTMLFANASSCHGRNLNTAGARNAYRFHTRSADEDVPDADACGPEETRACGGGVDVYVLSREGNGTASEALLDAVSARLNANEIRPLTDF